MRIKHYEKLSQPVASRTTFWRRMLVHGMIAAAMVALSMAVGMAGSMALGRMSAIDAFLFSSMILSGMGPVGDLSGSGMKLFAGLYAIACGLLLFAVAAVALAPVIHRALHLLHADDKD